jgi:hypothetical protein
MGISTKRLGARLKPGVFLPVGGRLVMKCLQGLGMCLLHALVVDAASASRSSERTSLRYDSRSGGNVQTFSLLNLFSHCGGDATLLGATTDQQD